MGWVKFKNKKETMITTRVHDEIANFVLGTGIQNVIEYKVPSEIQSRAEILLEKKRNKVMTEEENKELDAFLFFGHIMRIAKVRAHDKKRLFLS